jgi:hypothetical protein
MAQPPIFPIPYFKSVNPGELQNDFNLLIDEINLDFGAIGGAGVNVQSTSLATLRYWLSTNGSPLYIYTIDNMVSGDIGSTVNILWNHGFQIVQGDPLYNFITTTLGIGLPPLNSLSPFL